MYIKNFVPAKHVLLICAFKNARGDYSKILYSLFVFFINKNK